MNKEQFILDLQQQKYRQAILYFVHIKKSEELQSASNIMAELLLKNDEIIVDILRQELTDVELQILCERFQKDVFNILTEISPVVFQLKVLENTHNILQRLYEERPQCVERGRCVTVSLEKQAVLYKSQEELEKACDYFLAALNVAQHLYQQYPDLEIISRDLAVNFENLAGVFFTMGDMRRARRYYRNSLDIRQELWEKDPQAQHAKNLEVVLCKLADIYNESGRLEDAQECYLNLLCLSQSLQAQYPDDNNYIQDISVNYNRLGDFQLRQGKLQDALNFYDEALKICAENQSAIVLRDSCCKAIVDMKENNTPIEFFMEDLLQKLSKR